jgi:hypothetical protein
MAAPQQNLLAINPSFNEEERMRARRAGGVRRMAERGEGDKIDESVEKRQRRARLSRSIIRLFHLFASLAVLLGVISPFRLEVFIV